MALYKFQTANMNALTALKKHSLYCSSLEDVNDPTEAMFGILAGEKQINSTNIPNEDDLKNNAILCMATDTEAPSINSDLLMWTHYGNALSGICLVFDEEKLKNSLESQGCQTHKMVTYGYPKVLSTDNLIGEHWGIEKVPGVNFLDRNRERLLNSFLFNKPKCFSYENEYRFIFQRSGLVQYNPDCLKQIIIGNQINTIELRNLFTETAQSVNPCIEVYQASAKNNSFVISVEKCL